MRGGSPQGNDDHATGTIMQSAEVLSFWFSEVGRERWFAPTPELDREIRERFGELAARAAEGELQGWEQSRDGAVALCILLDQMPRNIHRGTPEVYAADHLGLAVARRAIARGFDRDLPPERKQFLYLPFSHSERLADQERAIALFEAAGLEEALVHVRGHLEIIRRFGRFPHRNAILGRASTPEEEAHLADNPSDYGQSAGRSDVGLEAGGRATDEQSIATRTSAGSEASDRARRRCPGALSACR
jgi:uncharacterized protein (DUF924 family)